MVINIKANGIAVGGMTGWVLGKQGRDTWLEMIDPMETVDVPNFDAAEVEHLLAYYARAGLLEKEEVDKDFLAKAYFLSAGNGNELFEFLLHRHVV